MRLKIALTALLLPLLSITAFAQIRDYNYRFQIKGVNEKDTIYLANYYGKGLYYFDTAYAAKGGVFAFKNKKELKPGMFALVFGKSMMTEVVINQQSFAAKMDTADLDNLTVFEGSPENDIFKAYKQRMIKANRDVQPIKALMDSAKDEKIKEGYRKQLQDLDEEVKAYQKQIADDNPNTFIGQMISMLVEVDVPPAPKDAKGNIIDSSFSYYYYKAHYFDRINLKHDYMVNCPIFHNKLETYFKNVILQFPDTICDETKRLVAKMDQKGDMFKYTVNYVNETYNKSELMGMDAVFVCLADEYYLSGKAFWLDTARMNKIREYAENIRPILIGKPAYNLSLADSTHKKWKKLYDEKGEYTVLVFWEPTCGHCKKEMPILAEMFNKTAGKDFSVYAVSSDSDELWKKFIIDNKMRFTNVAVPSEIKKDQNEIYRLVSGGYTDERSLNYHDTYDVFSTPKVFVLDKNKKIVAKQVAIDKLEELIQQLREIEKRKLAKS
ncbi:MAG: redoxin domain-containing protein [Bacteroidota bacterium]